MLLVPSGPCPIRCVCSPSPSATPWSCTTRYPCAPPRAEARADVAALALLEVAEGASSWPAAE
jgi:hypothetical protein